MEAEEEELNIILYLTPQTELCRQSLMTSVWKSPNGS